MATMKSELWMFVCMRVSDKNQVTFVLVWYNGSLYHAITCRVFFSHVTLYDLYIYIVIYTSIYNLCMYVHSCVFASVIGGRKVFSNRTNSY